MRRIIREKEPVRPSTRLSTMLQGEITTTAQRRRVSAPQLIHLLKGDLDWMVMKCLEKDRTRRYETASGLAADIQRYTNHEPVLARPPSRTYRLGKLVRRNKLAFGAGTAVAMALVAGIVVSTWQAARARRAEQAAKAEQDFAEAVLQFFRDKVLAAARPEGKEGGLGRDLTLREAIDAAESQITKAFRDRPLVEASIRKTLGESYRNLGEPALAVQQLERALALRRQGLGLEHAGTIDTMFLLAKAYSYAGKHSQALPLCEEALKLAKATLRPEDPEMVWRRNSLAARYKEAGRFEQSLSLYEETLKLAKAKLGSEHRETLITMNNLAVAYNEARKFEQAVPLLEEALKLHKTKLGSEHPEPLTVMVNLALAFSGAKKHDQALAVYEEAFRLHKAKLGPEDFRTLRVMGHLARAYHEAGKFEQALPLYEETLKLRQITLGPEHPDTLGSMDNVAGAYAETGRFDQALPLYEEVFRLQKAKLGPQHPNTIVTMWNLALTYSDVGKLDQPLPLCEEAVKLWKAKLGLEHPNTLRAMSHLAGLLYRQRRYADAEPPYREHLQSQRARLGPEHDDVIGTSASLARLLADWAWAERPDRGRSPSAAATNSQTGLELSKNLPSADVLRAGTSRAPYERAREAERLLRECLAVRLLGTTATHWRVWDVKNRLGGALVSVAVTDHELNSKARDAKLAEAETLLLESNQRLQESKSADKKYKRDALERLTRLYEAWGKPEKLSEWQQKLEAFDQKAKSATPEQK